MTGAAGPRHGAWRGAVAAAAGPIVVATLLLSAWEAAVRLGGVPAYVLPPPSLIVESLVENRAALARSLGVTLRITFAALALAALGGVGLGALFAQSRLVERSLFPYAVALQVTPIVAIAPLLLIYLGDSWVTLLVCAWLVAFFPILAGTTLGLASADRNLVDLFRLYRAGRWQILVRLRLPAALPHILGALRVAGGLSLIGAVVGEFAVGTPGAGSGLAYRILESGYRLDVPRMYAALLLLSLTGIAIFLAFTLLSHLMLRHWHESAVRQDR